MARGSDFDLFFIEHISEHHKNPGNEIFTSKTSHQKNACAAPDISMPHTHCYSVIAIQLLANTDQKVLSQAFFLDCAVAIH